ncbi:ankyrin repeat-containing protein [Legionella beliardensis]|uniref:Ankyrin repeat-containing protein n=1 Tax=Legionella beliardensis TaxID=91822 RepID=A0A378I1N7_9GAMM|nr:ankyrin repeat domain-containing protein [Legionella beliardensis]STX28546.1 ankyrin repeat-containing protein [Legionella beliardensis]
MPKLTHDDLIEVGTCLGYKSFEDGLCYGFSCMLAQAVLAQDTENFLNRLHLIASYKPDFQRLKNDIQSARKKVKNKEELDTETQNLLDILAFFDGIELYLYPEEHTELFSDGAYINQEKITAIYPHVKSKALEKTELIILLNKPYAFDEADLTSYLNDLATILKQTDSSFPILLGSGAHNVYLSYSKARDTWIYVDTNNFALDDKQDYFQELKLNELVDSIFASLSMNSSSVIFNTTLLASSNQKTESLKKSLATFDANYPIKSKQANMLDGDDVGLLFLACQKGNLNAVQTLLNEKGIDINQAEESKKTPLYIACQNGYLDIVQALLSKENININQVDEDNTTPLHIACENGYLTIVEELLKKKEAIDVNLENNDDVTPLYIACQNGHLAVVEALLGQKGIKINKAEKSHTTPLYSACENGHLAIVQALLRQEGIKINKANKDGATPLYIACQQGHTAIVELLLNQEGIEINQAERSGTTPLYVACQQGKTEVVKLLLARQQEIEIDSKGGLAQYTPLQIACASSLTKGKPALFQLLLDNKASVTYRNKLDQTALDIALLKKNDTAIATLLHFMQTHHINPCEVMSPIFLEAAIAWSKKENLPELTHYLQTNPMKQNDTTLVKRLHTFFSDAMPNKKIETTPEAALITNV